MFGSNILEIAIGMVFVFLLLSLVCSALNEFVEALVKNRAKDLETGIGELLGDPKNTSGFIEQIYNHGLVNSLYKGTYPPASKGDLPSYIPAHNFAVAIMDLVKNPLPDGITLPPNLTSALRTCQASAGDDLIRYQANLETWYNAGMDRVSGWYKRRTQWILVLLGLLVAIAINADSVRVARALSNDASLRQGLVATAQARASKSLNAADNSKADQDRIQQDLKDLNSLGLPIGWDNADGPKDLNSDDGKDTNWWMGLLNSAGNQAKILVFNLKEHGLGWILTAIAISMGAPFWFDLLNKIIAVRSTVKPEQSQSQSG